MGEKHAAMGLAPVGIPAAKVKHDNCLGCVQNTESKDPVCGGFLGSMIDEPSHARYRFHAAEQQKGTAAGVAGMAYDDDPEEEQQAVRLSLVPSCSSRCLQLGWEGCDQRPS